MRSLLSLLLLAGFAVSQQSLSLTTTFGSNNNQAGNMFDLRVIAPVTITDFDLNLDHGTWDVQVYRPLAGGPYGPVAGSPAAWTMVDARQGIVSNGPDQPTPMALSVPIPISPGQREGFYVTVTNGPAMNYTDGSSLGAAFAQDPVMTFFEGAGVAHPFGTSFSPRIWNGTIHYTVSGVTVGTNQQVGVGCNGATTGNGSVYELFDGQNSSFDLANTSHAYVWNGTGYVLQHRAPAAIVPPSGAGSLQMVDDDIRPVTLPFRFPNPAGLSNRVHLCSNGYLSFEPVTIAEFDEGRVPFLANQARCCFLWDDLDPSFAGSIDAEVDPGNANLFHITFTAVPEFGTGSPNTVQVSIARSGDIRITYGAVGLADCMIGITAGHGAPDPGGDDYSMLPSASLGPIVTGYAAPPLRLVGVTRPVVGATWNLEIREIRAGALFAVAVLGTADPGITDLFVLGLPGCQLRATLDALGGPFLIAPGQNVVGYGYDLSALSPAMVGVVLHAQGAVFGNGFNAFDAVTSNGIRALFGGI